MYPSLRLVSVRAFGDRPTLMDFNLFSFSFLQDDVPSTKGDEELSEAGPATEDVSRMSVREKYKRGLMPTRVSAEAGSGLKSGYSIGFSFSFQAVQHCPLCDHLSEGQLRRHLELKHRSEMRLPVKASIDNLIAQVKTWSARGIKLIRLDTAKSVFGPRLWSDPNVRKSLYKSVSSPTTTTTTPEPNPDRLLVSGCSRCNKSACGKGTGVCPAFLESI